MVSSLKGDNFFHMASNLEVDKNHKWYKNWWVIKRMLHIAWNKYIILDDSRGLMVVYNR